LRARTLSSVVSSLIVSAVAAAPAFGAAATGGAAAEPSPSSTTVAPKPAIHLSPVTARSRSVTYKGPVYEKTAAGEVVPFVSTAPAASTTAPVPSATGGSAVGTAASAGTTPSDLAPAQGAPAPQP
jgi:hypothetical protein